MLKMRIGLLFSFATFLLWSNLLLSKGGNLGYDHLAYSHKTLPIEELYFLSKERAVGLGKTQRNQGTPIYLLNRHNLVKDTFWFQTEPLNLIVSTDTTFFVQQEKKTLELLVRGNRFLLSNQLSLEDHESDNPYKILHEPLFLGNHVVGKSYQDKKDYKKNTYCLKMIELEDQKSSNSSLDLIERKKDHNRSEGDLCFALSDSRLFIFDQSKAKLLTVEMDRSMVNTLDFGNEKSRVRFHFDHLAEKAYLTKLSKDGKSWDLLQIMPDEKLEFKERMDSNPFAIVDNSIHVIKKKKDQYFHHLIPLTEYEGENNTILQEVQIRAE